MCLTRGFMSRSAWSKVALCDRAPLGSAGIASLYCLLMGPLQFGITNYSSVKCIILKRLAYFLVFRFWAFFFFLVILNGKQNKFITTWITVCEKRADGE